MDTIKFVIEDYVEEKAGFRFPVINIYINGSNLIDLVSEIENGQQGREKEKSDRWQYIGFEVSHFERFRNEMLGKMIYPRSVLLTCTCTYAECNCIMATIAIEAQTIIWSDLKSPWLGGKTPSPWIDEAEAQELDWHPLDYSGLGPFIFDREQYLSALDSVTQEWHLQQP